MSTKACVKKLDIAATCINHVAAKTSINIESSLESVLLDSGSPISFVSYSYMKSLEKKVRRKFVFSFVQKTWLTVSGNEFSSNHIVHLRVFVNNQEYLCPFYVIDSPVSIIFGCDNLKSLGCVLKFSENKTKFDFVGSAIEIDKTEFYKLFTLPNNWRESDLLLLKELLWKFRNIFSMHKFDFGRTGHVKHTIDTGDSEPICIRPYRRSLKEEEEIMTEVKSMLEAGVVEGSASPWCFPVVQVSKKDGTKKLAVDFRKLNQIAKMDRFPLPHLDSLLDRLSGAKVFSTLDLAAAYWNIPLDDSSKEKTAFQADNKLFQFTVMPYGLSAAPATMQRLLVNLIGELNLLPYLDDIIVPTKSISEQLELLESTFSRISEANLKLKPSKCFFGHSSVNYLGYRVSEGKLAPNPEKIDLIRNFPIPIDQKSLQKFLGVCQFYSRFVKNFSELALNLFQLQNCPKSKFFWSEECTKDFLRIKEAFTESLYLCQPDFNSPFKMDIDASAHSLGAVLYQNEDVPIAFASRKLSGSEKNYSTTDREFLALVWAVKHFRPYVYGNQKFEVFTDHKPLIHMRKTKPNNGRQARWQMTLEEYNFDLNYKKGETNIVADCLSRIDTGEDNSASMVSNVISVEEKNWKDEQESDQFCKSIFQELSKKTSKSGYSIDSNGVLRYYGRVVLPETHISHYINDYHSHGHASPANVRNVLLGAGYWFSRMRTRIIEETKNCSMCARKSYRSFNVPYSCLPNAPDILPFQLIAIDIVGSLPVAKSGYQYILTMVDHATRWLEAVPLTNIRAETCANAFLQQWVFRFGPPAQVHSDRGTQFLSEMFKHVSSQFGISNSKTTPFHPQGNGVLERFHRTFKDRIRTMHPKSWIDSVQEAVFNVNRISHNNGPSSFELVFQRKASVPTDWPSTDRFQESFTVKDGPPIGAQVARKNHLKKTFDPCFIGRFTVVDRPTNLTAKLSDNSVINIRDLRLI